MARAKNWPLLLNECVASFLKSADDVKSGVFQTLEKKENGMGFFLPMIYIVFKSEELINSARIYTQAMLFVCGYILY
jgi:hypothetical protein